MEDIVDTLGETAEVSAHRSQLDGTIDSVRRDAYADVDPANRPDHNDPESMNAAVPGIPEFASHADAREWAVERYFVALDPSASTEFQATLHGEVDKRRKLRAEDMLQVSTNAYALAAHMQATWQTEHAIRESLDEALGEADNPDSPGDRGPNCAWTVERGGLSSVSSWRRRSTRMVQCADARAMRARGTG